MIFSKHQIDVFHSLMNGAPPNFLRDSFSKDSLFHMHIPKTGGTYVNHFFKSLSLDFCCPSHLKCNPNIPLYPDPTDSIPTTGIYSDYSEFNESLRFCVVRNPFDWLTSYYFHTHGDERFPWHGIQGVGGIRFIYRTFEDFVDAYCDDEKYWQTGLSEFRRFYPFQIFDQSGTCQAHFIFKNGNNDELNFSCLMTAMAFGVSPDSIDKKFDSKIRQSKLKNRKYQEYYSPKMILKLNKKWEDILEVFGYNFDGSTDKKFMLDGHNIKYDIAENRLRRETFTWKFSDNLS